MTHVSPKPAADCHLAELAVFVHGILAAFHVLGVAYNARRRNWFDVSVHAACALYDTHAVVKHTRDVRLYARQEN